MDLGPEDSGILFSERKARLLFKERTRRLSPDGGVHRRRGAEVCTVTVTGADRTPCIGCLF